MRIKPGFRTDQSSFQTIIRKIHRLPSLVTMVLLAGLVAVLSSQSVAAQTRTLIAFGDSLTAGLGVGPTDSFPARLQAALRARGFDVVVQNAGVSGDTTAAGLARLDWALAEEASAVIVALGANDALRGLPPAEAEKNLDGIVGQITGRGLPVLVAGMLAPRNLGPEYAARYDGLFERVAKKHAALYYPFFLKDVATNPALNQSDGLHPNPAGVAVIVENILPLVETLLSRIKP